MDGTWREAALAPSRQGAIRTRSGRHPDACVGARLTASTPFDRNGVGQLPHVSTGFAGRHGRFGGVRDRGLRARRLRGVRRDGVRGPARLARGLPAAQAVGTFESALDGARSAAESALRVLREGPLKPDGVQIEFGVKMSTEASVSSRTACRSSSA
ncbi:CU044_2847 family protein [Streptomyces sp. NPDC056983]|uniref:CU044_2847 family protein n=1 Tax=Streptomyces sp. NPDC056983 TaxID=3345987 RepID=UPI0036428FA6